MNTRRVVVEVTQVDDQPSVVRMWPEGEEYNAIRRTALGDADLMKQVGDMVLQTLEA